MKVYVSVDMEGIAGVAQWPQVTVGDPAYALARDWMVGEALAAVEGARAAGAAEVLVNDSHDGMRNLPVDRMPPATRLITGSLKPQGMVAGLDGSFAAALFVGYHTRARGGGVLAHTWSNLTLWVKLNGVEVGEFGLNAMVAGHHGVPVVMVSGDDRLAEEARALIPEIEAVVVKRALTRFAAESLSHEEACARIRAAAERAVRRAGQVPPFRASAPIELEVAFQTPSAADGAETMPGARRLDELTVAWTAPDALQAYRAFRTMQALAGQAGR